VALVALALPALSSAFLFGVTVTTAAGAAALTVTATQLGLIGLGVVGAKLGLVTGALLGAEIAAKKQAKKQAINQAKGNYYYYKTYQTRGKREVSADVEEEYMLNQVMDDLLDEIRVGRMEGCFERLFCDITARPAEYSRNQALVDGVETAATSSTRYARPEAFAVSRKLLDAARYGQFLQENVSAGFDASTFCEQVYSQCHWTGKQLDQVITGYEKLAEQTGAAASLPMPVA